MLLDVDYKIICEFDITQIARQISDLDNEVWYRNTSRQDTRAHQRNTKTIFMNEVHASWNGDGYPITKFFINDYLNFYTDQITNYLENYFNGKVGKTMYINLPAGAEIYRHKDQGYYLTSVHRCHIPIITNELVEFNLNDITINMKAGTCYEISNSNWHGVFNKGSEDRVHLLVDIIPMEAFK